VPLFTGEWPTELTPLALFLVCGHLLELILFGSWVPMARVVFFVLAEGLGEDLRPS
jgi:hypothetical protein